MTQTRHASALLFGLALLAACEGPVSRNGAGSAAGGGAAVSAATAAQALQSITVQDLLTDIARLSSDDFGGRAPGTAGEDSTVVYLENRFRAMGLAPGNHDGTYVQAVTLVGVRNRARGSIEAGGETLTLTFPDNFAAVSYRDAQQARVEESPVVFVGYGVEAPEYDWDDYAGHDVSGKTLVVLVGDPPVVSPDDPSVLDPGVFNGRAMTYYGRWTYKYEIGAAKGAAAVIVVHETEPAGYPWEVVTGSWGPEQFDIVGAGGEDPLEVEAWITEATARALFEAAGEDFDDLKERARSRDFALVDLGATATLAVDMQRRTVDSRNVLAKLEGRDPSGRDEYIVYTAHWDHLGRDLDLPGDQIFNGALDNATGVAGMLEIAEAFTQLPSAPDRSILFLAVTAEEKGLLGARYYAENPLYPLARTLADINLDGVNQWGRTRDVVVVGSGNSSLEDVLARHAASQSRRLAPDPEPEKGFFYRSDHFEFAKQGVPSLYIDTGTEFIGRREGYGQQKRDEYTALDYHKPSDEVKPDWDLSGALEDLRLLFLVGWDVAQTPAYPTWNGGTEFKATREAMLAGG